MATTTSRPSHAPNVVLIVGTAPMIPQIRSQVRLLPDGTPTQPDTSRNRPAGAPLKPPPVIDGIIDGIEELDFLESGLQCAFTPLAGDLKTTKTDK